MSYDLTCTCPETISDIRAICCLRTDQKEFVLRTTRCKNWKEGALAYCENNEPDLYQKLLNFDDSFIKKWWWNNDKQNEFREFYLQDFIDDAAGFTEAKTGRRIRQLMNIRLDKALDDYNKYRKDTISVSFTFSPREDYEDGVWDSHNSTIRDWAALICDENYDCLDTFPTFTRTRDEKQCETITITFNPIRNVVLSNKGDKIYLEQKWVETVAEDDM